MNQNNYPWNTKESSYKEALKYIHDRMIGKVKSLITPWPRINAVGINGWEFGSAIGLFSRPGCGKSVKVEQLCKEVFSLNPDLNLRILRFDLEMPLRVNAIREFSSVLSQSYAYICNAEESILLDDNGYKTGNKKISKEEILKCWNYVQRKTEKDKDGNQRFPEDVIERSPTVKEFEKIIHQYMETYAAINSEGVKIFPNVLVTIDHIRLFMCEDRESEQQMLYSAWLTINRLKKQYGYPIVFFVLGHLGRDVNDDSRTENGKHSNYLRDSDIFMADAAMQNGDIIIVMDRPHLRNITRYGPSNFIIDDPNILVYQFVKVRNGVPGMAFFLGEFDKMRIIEIENPPKAATKAAENRHYYEEQKSKYGQVKANF